MSLFEEVNAAVLRTFAAPVAYIGRPPGDPPDCRCFHCCVDARLNPDRLRLHEAGAIDMTAEIERTVGGGPGYPSTTS